MLYKTFKSSKHSVTYVTAVSEENYNDESGDNGFAVEDIITANVSHVAKQQSLFVSNVLLYVYDMIDVKRPRL